MSMDRRNKRGEGAMRATRRGVLGLLGGALVVPATAKRALGDDMRLPSYEITDSKITVSKAMPVRRPDTPVPSDAGLLFYIQHSQNPNTIVYTTRQGAGGGLDRSDPVDVFWRRFSRQNERDELTFFERFFVFGARTSRAKGAAERYAIRLAAYAGASGVLEIGPDGKARIVGKLGDRDVRVVYAYAELGDRAFIPKIEFIDVIGEDLATGEFVTRRVKVGF
ncbi:MAG: DUF4833 domain-containing protein [Hyphomicrobiales bacterium]